jgi:hypothetical protein
LRAGRSKSGGRIPVPHGQWLTWLKENVAEIDGRQAQRHMEFAKCVVTSDLSPLEQWVEWQRIQGNEPADGGLPNWSLRPI